MVEISVWRIVDKRYWEGRLEAAFGRRARWHSGGRKVIYCAESPALAVLERIKGFLNPSVRMTELAQRRFLIMRLDLRIAEVARVDPDDLARGWWKTPPWKAVRTQETGNAWLDTERSVALRVPSAALPAPTSWNYLLNPRHPDFEAALLMDDPETIEPDFSHYL
jgi:RES domain-containing protein